MKTITILIFSVVINGCGGAKEASATENMNTATDEKTSVAFAKEQEPFTIEYSAMSRGSSKLVKIADKNIEYKMGRNTKADTKVCSDVEWSKLKLMVGDLNLEGLPKLEPPSKKHQYDGALIASLTITSGDKIYQTPSFDHGSPPKEIESLVKYILSMVEMVD